MNHKSEINQIQFSTRNGPKGPSIGIQLGRHWVFKDIVVYAWNRVLKSLSDLDPSKKYLVNDLVNDPAWCKKGFGVRIAIGRCMSMFVALGMLPLKLMNPGKKGPRRYGCI